jgi:hypothetical protein
MAVAAGIALLYLGIGRMGSTVAYLNDQELSNGNLIRAGVWEESSNLVLDLEFDKGGGTTADDSSPYNNDGTIFGASWIEEPSGPGWALSFDGTDDYVQVSDSPTLQVTDALTMEAWMNLTPRADGNDQSLLMKGAYDWYLGVWGTERTPSGIIEFFAGDDVGGWHGLAGSTSVDDGQWHHVATTYDGSKIRVYVDGAIDGETATSFTFKTSTDDLLISKGGGRWVQGDVDRVRVYNRALSPSEVQQSYNESVSHYIP